MAVLLCGLARPTSAAAQTACPTASLFAYSQRAADQWCDVGAFSFAFPDFLTMGGGKSGTFLHPNPSNVLVTPVSYGTATDGAAGLRFTLNGELRSSSDVAMTGNNGCARVGTFCQFMNLFMQFGLTTRYLGPDPGVAFAIGLVNIDEELVATTPGWQGQFSPSTYTDAGLVPRYADYGIPIRYHEYSNGVPRIRCLNANIFLPPAPTPNDCQTIPLPLHNHVDFHIFTQVGLYDPSLPGQGAASPVGTAIADVRAFEVLAYSHTVLPPPYVAPEPATVGLVATGLVGLGGMTWRRRRRA